jgi:hypothetical protein
MDHPRFHDEGGEGGEGCVDFTFVGYVRNECMYFDGREEGFDMFLCSEKMFLSVAYNGDV